MRKVFISIFLLPFSLFSEEFNWSLKFKPVQDVFLLMEPFVVEVKVSNKTKGELGPFEVPHRLYLDGKQCNNDMPAPNLHGIIGIEFEDLQNFIKNYKSRDYFPFLLNLTCNSALAPTWWKNDERDDFIGTHTFCYEAKYMKYYYLSCMEFKVEYPPLGDDRDAYKKFLKGKVPDVTFLNEKEKEALLLEYSASRYAGWILPKSYPSFLAFTSGKELINDLLKCRGKRQFDSIWQSDKRLDGNIADPEEEAQKYIKSASFFLKKHKSHPLSAMIYCNAAYFYIVLGQWREALEMAEESLNLDWPEWYFYLNLSEIKDQRRFLKEAKEEIIRKGLESQKEKTIK